jgi:colicin import membrane protein
MAASKQIVTEKQNLLRQIEAEKNPALKAELQEKLAQIDRQVYAGTGSTGAVQVPVTADEQKQSERVAKADAKAKAKALKQAEFRAKAEAKAKAKALKIAEAKAKVEAKAKAKALKIAEKKAKSEARSKAQAEKLMARKAKEKAKADKKIAKEKLIADRTKLTDMIDEEIASTHDRLVKKFTDLDVVQTLLGKIYGKVRDERKAQKK